MNRPHVPFAVVIEVLHTLIAHAAVFGARAFDFDVAQVAAPVLDDMCMLGAIEFGHDPLGALLAQLHVGRIDEQRGQMRGKMHRIQAPDHIDQRRLQRRMQRRYQHQKRRHPKSDDGHPAAQLQRMQRKLDAVQAAAPLQIVVGHIVLERDARSAAPAVRSPLRRLAVLVGRLRRRRHGRRIRGVRWRCVVVAGAARARLRLPGRRAAVVAHAAHIDEAVLVRFVGCDCDCGGVWLLLSEHFPI